MLRGIIAKKNIYIYIYHINNFEKFLDKRQKNFKFLFHVTKVDFFLPK